MSVFFELLGAIALLLWGLRMVRTGVMRTYGTRLTKLARQAEGRIVPTFLSGMFVAILLQSSTATAMIVASFSGQGILSATSAFITILGADIGTAIAVLIASQKINLVSPLFLAIGIFGFLSTENSKTGNVFRAIAGLGMILLALSLIASVAANLTDLQGFNTVVQVFVTEPFLMILFGLVLTYLAHSSLAIVLLAVGFVQSSFLGIESGLFLVLGANIGSGLLPVVANWSALRDARTPVTANLLIRVVGVIAVFPFIGLILENYGNYFATAIIPAAFHFALNFGVAISGVVLAPLMIKLSLNLLPEDKIDNNFITPKHLDEEVFSSPTQALACAKREALNMADIAQTMLQKALPALKEGDDNLRREVLSMDDSVDRLFNAIKIYIARIMQEELSEDETQRAMDLISFTANMEHIGDIVDGSLMDIVSKKIKLQAQFSDEGLAEITKLHEAVCATFELAINTFVSDDSELARLLYEAKANIRKLENRSVTTHLERIGTGISDSLETSSLHLDVIRDLKRINSHLTSIAYPVLKLSGEVPKTKWKRTH